MDMKALYIPFLIILAGGCSSNKIQELEDKISLLESELAQLNKGLIENQKNLKSDITALQSSIKVLDGEICNIRKRTDHFTMARNGAPNYSLNFKSIDINKVPKIICGQELHFAGYYLTKNISKITTKPGIYLAHSCRYKPKNNTVNLNKLLYIGQNANIQRAIRNHNTTKAWEKYLTPGEELCYSFSILQKDRQRIHSVLVNTYKTQANIVKANAHVYPKTTLKIKGNSGNLDNYINSDLKLISSD